jgi:hypothetical protein
VSAYENGRKRPKLFFSLPASDGFVLAGGAALIAQHLTYDKAELLEWATALTPGFDRAYFVEALDMLPATRTPT